MKNTLFYTHFSPQNAGNKILGFEISKLSEGACPQTPLEVRINGTLLAQSGILFKPAVATAIIIEVHVAPLVVQVQNPFHQSLKATVATF